MRALLETTAISDILSREPNTMARVNALSKTDTARASVVSYGEIWVGLETMPPGQRRAEYQRRAQILFVGLPLEFVTRAVADAYVQIKAELQRRGQMIPEADLWIAATALAGNYTLVTRDGHFSRVNGLNTVDWSQP
jgi:tRNA(fMet)-specific endonuclease VapC